MKSRFSPLDAWLSKRDTLPRLFNILENKDDKIETCLSLDVFKPLYKAFEIPAQSLSKSWDSFNEYLVDSLEVINWDYDTTLDSEEAYYIKEKLGDPPICCYPIYIVTVSDSDMEKMVYIGKTSSKYNRFAGGHTVGLKLLNPIYEGLNKNIYLGTVVFWNTLENKHLPLEWVSSKDVALDILDSVESELIYNFKPELNINKKKKNYSKYPINFHIQNFTEKTEFLNDKFIQNY